MNNGTYGSSTVSARHDYLPFGEEIWSGTGLRSSSQGYGTTDRNRQKYGMTERDDATGLDHTWWRKYESTAGRWTSPDPAGGKLHNPQSFNHYTYAANDPVNLVDPNGLMCIQFHFTNTSNPSDNFWTPWYCTPGISNLDPKGGAARLTKAQLEEYNRIKAAADKTLHNGRCEVFLASRLSVGEVTAALDKQKPFNGNQTTLTALEAGLAKPGFAIANDSVGSLFTLRPDASAMTAIFSEATRFNVYLNLTKGYSTLTLVHEALHSATRLNDIDLAFRLTGELFGPDHSQEASQAITNALVDNGCG